MKEYSKFSLTLCAVLLGAAVGSAQDWPQWRGPNRDGKISGVTLPATWPKELSQKWKVTVGAADCGPVLVGDKVYVFARQNNQEILRCLKLGDGSEVWQDKYDAPSVSGPDSSAHSGPRSTPAVASGKVVTLGVGGTLSCLDATSGKVLWRKDEFPGSFPRFHVAMSPLLKDNVCYAHLGKAGEGALIAYDLASGEAKWKWTGDGPAYASPVMAKIGGADVLVAQTDKKMICLNAADGKLLWETAFAPQGMAYNAATPIIDGQTLIYCGQGRGATAVKLEKSGDTISATELWKNPDNSVQFNTPVLKDGFLYGLSAKSDFFCIDAKDGKTAWTAPLTAPAAGGEGEGGGRRGGGRSAGYGSLIDAGKVILALTPNSQLVVFKPDEKAYSELARIKVADTPVYAHPVVSGNKLIVKDQESLILWEL